jgi:glycosyltransferase involved in cell wall biosynthesis
MKRLAIVTSHPIQYNAPWFRLLTVSGKVMVKVFYTWEQSQTGPKYDPGFGKVIEWDIPLLEGYEYTFVKNIASEPGSHHYKGMINPTLIEEIKSWQAEAVLVIGWSFKSHLQCMRYFHGKIPVLFRGDSTLLDEKRGWRLFARRIFLRWVYSHIDYALYTGINNRLYFEKHGVRDRRLVFAPHAIDNDRFGRNHESFEAEARNWRNELGIAATDLVVLFAGKLEQKKNPRLLIEIAAGLNDQNIKFLVVGNGKQEEMLKQAAAGDKRIIFLDFQNQLRMPVLYRVGDVFILPSGGPGETWGLAINEAMACSRAVMVSDKTGCAPDLVKENENGIVFKYDDSAKCRHFLQSLLADRKKLSLMGQQSAKIISTFSYENIVAAIVATLNKTNA